MKAIFFDQDNTIFNTAEVAPGCYDSAFSFLSANSGVEKILLMQEWEKEVHELKTSSNPKFRNFQYSLSVVAKKFKVEKFVGMTIGHFHKMLEERIDLTPGTKEFFEKDLDIKKILITEDDEKTSDLKLDKFDLKDKFDLILRSNDIGVMKPNIKYLETAWQEFNLKPDECIYVGDNWDKDCRLGQLAGGVGVVFGKDDNRANYVIYDMGELIKVLKN